MRQAGVQVLTHTLRLPDEQQAQALRWLAFSRNTVNTVLRSLWLHLDEFSGGKHQAWKQVLSLLAAPHQNGSRQWRCEAETAGRILRAQAARKAAFETVRPLLSEGLIRPGSGQYPARKDRRALLQSVSDLRGHSGDEASKAGLWLNVLEQACNYYLANGHFPVDYFEMQAVPFLKVGLLAFAADDGPKKGQTYRLAFEAGRVQFRFRTPDEQGSWKWGQAAEMRLPEATQALLSKSVPAAPQLRELVRADGTSLAVLDLVFEVASAPVPELKDCQRVLSFDWGVRTLLTVAVVDIQGAQLSRPLFFDTGGFDGKQARLRRQIDQLKARCDGLPEKQPERVRLQHEIDLCWEAYTRRNKALAHLAANFLLIVAGLYGCQVIAGEWLATLKSVGRGRDTQGRWRNWRNNTQLRSAITTVLEYKCKPAGKVLRLEYPRGTSHTCPHCGKPANTFRSPEHTTPCEWGAWLKCAECRWSGSRDYAAALNIGRAAVAYLTQAYSSSPKKNKCGFRMSDPELKPVSYSGSGAAQPFPPPNRTLICPQADRRTHSPKGTTFSVLGWPDLVKIHPLRPLGLRC
jgi:hypothetical protein